MTFTMGNKQTVFTHEQLEAYQVGVMRGALTPVVGLAALESWPGEWGQHSLVLGVLSARVSVCSIGRDEHGVLGRGRKPPWAGSGPSQHLFPQDCTFFTRKEIMRSVRGGREEDLETTFYTLLEDAVCQDSMLHGRALVVRGWRQRWGG